MLADLAVFSRTKRDKERIEAKPNSRADSALAAVGASIQLRLTRKLLMRNDSINTPASIYNRKHTRAANVLDGPDEIIYTFFFISQYSRRTV